QPAIPDCPTTTEPLAEAAAAVAGPWPRFPRSCTIPARQRKAWPRNVVLSYDIPTITLPSADTAFAWPCSSLGSVVRNSKLGGDVVAKRNDGGIRESWEGMASPTMTEPVAEMPKARFTL